MPVNFSRLNDQAIKVGLKAILKGFKKWPPKLEKVRPKLVLSAKRPFGDLVPKFGGISGTAILLFERQFSNLALSACIDYAKDDKKIVFSKLERNKVFLALAYRRALNSFHGLDFDKSVFTALAFGNYAGLVKKFESSKVKKYKLEKGQKLSKREFMYLTSIYFDFMEYIIGYFNEYIEKN